VNYDPEPPEHTPHANEDGYGRDERRKTGDGGGVMCTVMSCFHQIGIIKKGNRNSAIPHDYLVAGPGFEPGPFGL
jgi:hypothetical protein